MAGSAGAGPEHGSNFVGSSFALRAVWVILELPGADLAPRPVLSRSPRPASRPRRSRACQLRPARAARAAGGLRLSRRRTQNRLGSAAPGGDAVCGLGDGATWSGLPDRRTEPDSPAGHRAFELPARPAALTAFPQV